MRVQRHHVEETVLVFSQTLSHKPEGTVKGGGVVFVMLSRQMHTAAMEKH